MIFAPRIRFHVWHHTKDRRTVKQLSRASAKAQAKADEEIEALWRQRVRENEKRRISRRLARTALPTLLLRQAQ
jgi:hypothetical protein